MKRQGKKEEDEEEEANTQEVCSLQGGGMQALRSQVIWNGQAVVRDDDVSCDMSFEKWSQVIWNGQAVIRDGGVSCDMSFEQLCQGVWNCVVVVSFGHCFV